MTVDFIPYGTATVAPMQREALATGRLRDLDRPGAPVAVIDRNAGPLRLHQLRHPFTRPPVVQNLAHGEAQVAFLEAHLASLCGPWNRPLRGLVGTYFTAIRAQLNARTAELAERLGPVIGLAEPAHWVLSAPMPLPRAHLPTGGAFTDADLVFWDGRDMICCFVGNDHPVGARRRAMEVLGAEGARVEKLGRDVLDAPDILLNRLGPVFADVTAGETLPQSPFRGQSIPRPT